MRVSGQHIAIMEIAEVVNDERSSDQHEDYDTNGELDAARKCLYDTIRYFISVAALLQTS